MPSNEIHVGDVGTTFTFTIRDENDAVVNLATASVSIIFGKPDSTQITKSGSLIGGGIGGQVSYTTVDGDLDLHGVWSVQAFVEFSSDKFYSDIQKFKVYRNISCA